jgi:hypothetical protein
MLPEVMNRLEAAGARYVTLAQAQSDPAYAQAGGGSVINRTARQNGVDLSDLAAGEPSADVKEFCR